MSNKFMGIWKDVIEREFSSLGLKNRGKVVKVSEHQTDKSIKSIDIKRDAMPSGKRISRYGNVYYEYRKNRSDITGTKV